MIFARFLETEDEKEDGVRRRTKEQERQRGSEPWEG